MGCWNRGVTSPHDEKIAHDEDIPRDKVLDSIASYLEDTEGQEIPVVIAGDNIYPREGGEELSGNVAWKLESDGKVKVYNSGVLKTGFQKLANVRHGKKNKIHMILGNHNVKVNHTGHSEILSMEVNVAKKHQFDFHVGNTAADFGSLVRFLFINTNDQEDLEGTASFIETNRAAGKWTIVVGHEPLFSCKEKKMGVYKIGVLKGFPRLMEALSHPGTVYMCADVHNFQTGRVSYRGRQVMQIVSGTGGAKPDRIQEGAQHHEARLDGQIIDYDIWAQSNPYGFCEMQVSKSQIQVTYRHINGTKNDIVIIPHSDQF